MEINVNKGIISFSYEHPSKGTTLSYQYDINKNIFIGKSGRQVKTLQNKSSLYRQLKEELHIGSFYEKASKKTTKSLTLIAFLYGLDIHWGEQYFNYLVALANKLDNLNLNIVKHLHSIHDIIYLSRFNNNGKEIKKFKEWFERKLTNNVNFTFSFDEFTDYLSNMKILENHPLLKDITNTKEREYVIDRFYKGNYWASFNNEEKVIAEYYYIQRQLYKIDFLENEIFRSWNNNRLLTIHRYFTICRKMGIKPQKEKDFFRLYKDTLNTYYYNKQEYDNKTFKRNYEKQKNAFTFSYGNYEIVIPQEPQDLIKEGQEMHHCVGSYVDKVVNNDCYIVFIRNKNDLTVPYITAEITVKGKLGQYYLAYDKRITRDKDIEFKEMFQMHLTKNWVD